MHIHIDNTCADRFDEFGELGRSDALCGSANDIG